MRASTMTFAGNSSSIRKSYNNTSGTAVGIERVESSITAEGAAVRPAHTEDMFLAASSKNSGGHQRIMRGSGVTVNTETAVIQDEDEDSTPLMMMIQIRIEKKQIRNIDNNFVVSKIVIVGHNRSGVVTWGRSYRWGCPSPWASCH